MVQFGRLVLDGAGGTGERRLLLIETSDKSSFERTRQFYRKHGYAEVVHIPDFFADAASKAHALSFTEGFAREVRSDGIAVLALCPGPTSTEIWPTGATPTLPMRREVVAGLALKRLGKRTTVVAGLLNRLITFSTRFVPRWMNSLIFGKVVGGCSRPPWRIPGSSSRPGYGVSNNDPHGMTHG